MRSFSFVILVFGTLFFSACEKDKCIADPTFENKEFLIGKWKLTESAFSIGGPLIWQNVDNGEEIEFYKNGTFMSSRFDQCKTGNYNVENNTLILLFTCAGFTDKSMNDQGEIEHYIEFFSCHFHLSRPRALGQCIEGCPNKYERL